MQREKVANPPLTISDSVGVNSRVPPRINTLFRLFRLFSFYSFGSVERAQKLFKESLFGGAGKGRRLNHSTAFVEIAVKGAGYSQAAFGRRPESAAYLVDFLLVQVTSAPASQHSVLIIHGVSPLKKVFGSAGRSRRRLAANLTYVLISIRRRRVGAERKGNKSSVD